MPGGCSAGTNFVLRPAQGSEELEEVFRFRYEHFFRCFADGYPGLDRTHRRLFEPHDRGSTHYCAFDTHGKLCAVSTATRADAPDIPGDWRHWFQLGRLAPLGLRNTVISTRMVIDPAYRHGTLFAEFYAFIMERYIETGFDYAAHFCAPGYVCRYEKLGHRLFGAPFTMQPGLLRVPMLIALNDLDHLQRLNPPLAMLCTAASRRPSPLLPTALPELFTLPNFRLLSPEERLAHVLSHTEGARLPGPSTVLPVLDYASPLQLSAGLSHAGPASVGILCLVLSGMLREHGADTPARAGSFVGTGCMLHPDSPSQPFTVLADAEVLVFDQNLIRCAALSSPLQEGTSTWDLLCRASALAASSGANPPGIKEKRPCGMPSSNGRQAS